MATIEKYQTSSGAMRYRVRYRTPDNRQTDKRGFRTKRDAQAWAEQLEVDKRRGVYVAPAAGRVKLGEYAREWLASKHKLKPSTRARYQVVLDTVIAAHADVALGDISRQLAREWVAGVYRPLVYVPGACGLRFGEVAELRWRDVDLPGLRLRIARSVTLVDGVFEIGSPKSGKGRTVSLPAFVAELLTRGETDALVFPDSEGGHMRGTNVRRRWWSQAVAGAELFPRTIVDAAGEQSTVYDFKLHELRHTAASLAIQAGANI
jgi:integrase